MIENEWEDDSGMEEDINTYRHSSNNERKCQKKHNKAAYVDTKNHFEENYSDTLIHSGNCTISSINRKYEADVSLMYKEWGNDSGMEEDIILCNQSSNIERKCQKKHNEAANVDTKNHFKDHYSDAMKISEKCTTFSHTEYEANDNNHNNESKNDDAEGNSNFGDTDDDSEDNSDNNHDDESSDDECSDDEDEIKDNEPVTVNKTAEVPGFNYLKCLYTNADGLLNKLQDFKVKISEEKPDIISIVESHLQKDDKNIKYCPDEVLYIPGYNMYRKDNTEAVRGGILVYVKDNIIVTEDKVINGITSDFKESLWLVLKVGTDNVLLGTVYRKGSSKVGNNKILRNAIEKASKKYNKLIITGDFNHPEIDWVNSVVKGGKFTPAMRFYDCIMNNYLQQHVNTPTRARGSDKPSLLDLVITESSQTQVLPSLNVMEPFGLSDHSVITWKYLVSTTITDSITNEAEEPPKRNYTKVDYDKLNELLLDVQWATKFNGRNVDECMNILYEEVDAVAERCIPRKKNSKWHDRPPWMTKAARKCIRKKRCAWNRYLASPNYQKYMQYVKQRNVTTKKLRKAQREFEKNLAKNCKKNPKSLFKYANFKSNVKNNVIRLKDKEGNIKMTDLENAEILNTFFESVFTVEEDAETLEKVTKEEKALPDWLNYKGNICNDRLETFEITDSMIRDELQAIDPYKSNVKDCIHPKILKEGADSLLEPLKHIYNLSLREGKLPEMWKRGTITALHKGEDRHQAENYRPVTITSTLCRMLERILKKPILKHIEDNNLLVNEQHGFVGRRSCLSNLLLNMEKITETYDKGLPMDQIFLDLQKAFDSVPHQRLLCKLQQIGIHGEIYEWIKSFLSERYQRVGVNGVHSGWTKVRSGVPQGSVLGPILFIIFINDLPEHIEAWSSIFADDTKVLETVTNEDDCKRLQKDLDDLVEWAETWKLKFNPEKCKLMHIGYRNNHYNYYMKGHMLKKVETEKDLGVIMSHDLKPHANIEHHVKKANKMLGIIRRTFKYLNEDSFLALYKAYVRPHLEYCQQVSYPYLQKDADELENVQRRATKLVNTIRHLDYEDRLKKLNLFTLKQRRARGDMIMVYKILHGYININVSELFDLNTSSRTRGHKYKLIVPKVAKTEARRESFSQRTIIPWNNLPEHITSSNNVDEFKKGYDKYISLK